MNNLKLKEVLMGHTEDRIWYASWSSDGNYLATSGEDKVIRIWRIDNYECISTLEEGQNRTIRSCEWSPDNNLIASASFDGTVVVWESQNSSHSKWDIVASLEGHENEVKSVCWNRAGNLLATCGRDKRVWIWEKLEGFEFECLAMLDGHSQDVKFVIWHPNFEILFSTSYDNSVKLWKEDAGDWYCANTLEGHQSTVWNCCFNPSGDQMLTSSEDKSIKLWVLIEPSSGLEWNIIQNIRDVHDHPVYSVSWNFFCNYVISGGGDNKINLYLRDSNGINFVCDMKEAHESDINCLRYFKHILLSIII